MYINYPPKMKLREGNVFTGMYLFTVGLRAWSGDVRGAEGEYMFRKGT